MNKTTGLCMLVVVLAVVSGCSKASPVGPETSAARSPSFSTVLSFDDWLATDNMTQADLAYYDSFGWLINGMTYSAYFRQAYDAYVALQSGSNNGGSTCTDGGGGGSVTSPGNMKDTSIGKTTNTTVGNERNTTIGRN